MRYLLQICLVFSVTACATPYQTSGFTGGVSITQLNTSVYDINAAGNGFTGAERVKHFALLRAAETCLDNGFSSFVPIASNASTSTHTLHNNNYNTTCNSYEYSIDCSTFGGETTTITKPKQNMTVKMFRDEELAPSSAFSCQIIYNNLAPRYKKG